MPDYGIALPADQNEFDLALPSRRRITSRGENRKRALCRIPHRPGLGNPAFCDRTVAPIAASAQNTTTILEIAKYATRKSDRTLARRPPYNITEYLAIGPCRGAGGPTVTTLARAGFKHIIDLNADNSERSLSKRAGLSYHPIKTIDEHSRKVWLKNLQETVNIIDQAARAGERVYLHCTYGRGRSATMAMAYLLSKNWSVKEAIECVKAKGSQIWCEGNPVSRYERILQSYSGSVVGRPPNKRA